jgi:NADPH2:quinone reductase
MVSVPGADTGAGRGLAANAIANEEAIALAPVMYHTVARVGEIAEGRGIPVEIEGRVIAVFRDEGDYYAIDDACPHKGAPLCDGIVFDKTVTCTWHGWRFSLETGRSIDSPKSRTRTGTYPVRVEGDLIQVALEQPEKNEMRAAFITETGPTDVIKIGELPQPEPGPGQVLVKVHAAALNPIDLYLRSGLVPMPLSFPYVIGCDVAGTVAKLGPGATRFTIGDRVWGSNQGLLGRQGVAAQFAAIDQEWLYPTPEPLTDNEAAAMALVGITSHLALFRFGQLKSGESVYIPGGSGGIGSVAVQMAKASGARVATSAGSPERVELCQSLGADVALNYKTDNLPVRLREFAPEGVDVWYETQREPNLEVAIPLLRKHGRLILMAGRTAKPALPLGAFYPRNCAIFGFAVFNSPPAEQEHCAAGIIRFVQNGSLKPLVGRTFPLAEAAEAQRFLEENTLKGAGSLTGKVVITIP